MRTKEKEFQRTHWSSVWADSFSEERYEKEHPKSNDAPSLEILDSFLFIFGVFAAISAFMRNLVAPRHYWLWFDHLDPWKICSYISCTYFFYQYMDGTKIVASVLLFGNPCRFLLESYSFGSSSYPLLHYSLKSSTFFRCFCHHFGSSSTCLSPKRFNIKSSEHSLQLDAKRNG